MADENHMELPADLPLIYPESVTVNLLNLINMGGTEPTVLFAFGGVLETDPSRPFEENPKGNIGIVLHPNVVKAMIPLIMQVLTWKPGDDNPGGTMILDWPSNTEGMGRGGRGDQPGGEGPGEGASEGVAPVAGEGAGGGRELGAGPGGGEVPGGDGAGVAGGDVAAAGRDEVAPVPAPADVNGCIHPAQMVIRAHDPKSGELKRVYCGVCGLEFD